MKGLQLSSEEKQLLIEALLYSTTPDVIAEWTSHQLALLRSIAKKLNEENVKLSNIYLFGCESYQLTEESTQIVKDFPNLPRVGVITD